MTLLRGRDAAHARATLADLSATYLRLRTARQTDISLGGGLAGLALVNAALEPLFPRRGHAARAEEALARAFAHLSRKAFVPGLYRGLAGLGWVTSRLVAHGAGEDDDPCAVFDDAIGGLLEKTSWTDPFDVVHGLAGFGVYALERLPSAPKPAKRLLARVVSHLGRTARRRRPGIAWWSDPAWNPVRRRQTGEYNLGLAHGGPGVIALLGRVVAADVDPSTRKEARALLASAVPWLLAQRLPPGAQGSFTYTLAPGEPRDPARLAWCYGDASIAVALLGAARAARKPAWERLALRLGLGAAARPQADAGVVDAGLCHGAAGVAHIFHRLHLETGEPRFAAAARSWFTQTLALREPTRGFAGFRAFVPDTKGGGRWHVDAGFMTGAAGITLALVAATTNRAPEWDRLLLLS
jgi:hypothetical protein